MKRKLLIPTFVVAVVAIPIFLFAVVVWTSNEFSDLPVLNADKQSIQDFSMKDQDGKIITKDSLQGSVRVVNFFFTSCPSVCPKMTNQLKRVQAYSGWSDIPVYSFTVDPVRDSVQRLKDYEKRMSITGNWHLVTGEKIQIYRLARKGFNIVATDGDGGENDFIHSELLILLDKKGRIRGYYNGTEKDEVDQLINDIKKLKKAEENHN